MSKFVYKFSEGNGTMRELLGGKGANLAEMTRIGLPVPTGFIVTTEACNDYYAQKATMSSAIVEEIREHVASLEERTGKKFGDLENPLLVSVRSGSRASMPGMMDTVLNLGINDVVVESLVKKSGNEKFAYDSYRRFIQMFADVVMEVPKAEFEVIIDEMKEARGITLDSEFTGDDLKEMVQKFKDYYRSQKNVDFPDDPFEQLIEAIKAVFKSWNNDRAIYYRHMHDIPGSWGTAVNVQEMVFGNLGEDSASGVAFTRNPATGEKAIFGEYLVNAQGEDVVAGTRTPSPMSELETQMPEIYKQFTEFSAILENHYKDMQDLEFTIEQGVLYMLQTRSGKRTAAAALKIAVDLVAEGLITKEEAVLQINPQLLDALLHPQFDEADLAKANVVGSGLAASPGAATGRVVFTAEQAKEWADRGEKVVLVRLETSPEDIEGMHVSSGILTARGGMTSHAAVVARGIGTCCVSGVKELHFNANGFELGGNQFNLGDPISLDGTTGRVYSGNIKTVDATISGDFEEFMGWADEFRTMGVRTNADSPADAAKAIDFGAEGIGLVRTEHMFFEADRIKAMREMIVAKTEESRRKALAKLLPIQQKDFEGIYEVMKELPVTIRYLDPPLHEFLPTEEKDILEIATELEMEVSELKEIIASLHEFNPMMGHRGVRLAVSYPEIAEMQTTAVIQAALAVSKRLNISIHPEIMIPLVGDVKELTYVKEFVVETADRLIAESGQTLEYSVGTMIEIPRACLVADEIAKEADFFSFGTNDLTQMTFGFSRDDAATFLTDYYDKNVYERDPFARMDQEGVGQLVKTAVKLGRSTKPDLKCGICGEHGGDPATIEYLYQVGLDYVSCSPFRVPIARLAAAQASIKYGK